MAHYWVYLNNEVSGPFEIEQLIRVRGFSRQTLVRVDDPSNKSTQWISPAEIPELAHIFKAADDRCVNSCSRASEGRSQSPAASDAEAGGSCSAGPRSP